MIDIHCHLLPGIDDGAQDMDEALTLLQMAVDDGITHVVLTPHLHFGRFENFKSVIEREFAIFEAAVIERGIKVKLSFAAEVRLDALILQLVDKHSLPLYIGQAQICRKNYMLLEFPHSHIPPGSDMLIKYLISQNIIPIIAHPERNRDLLKSPNKIKPFVRLGCMLQLTAGSITGKFGEQCQVLALDYLAQGIIDVVATDAHTINRRPPVLSEARAKVTELHGEATAQSLFHTNPLLIIGQA